MEKDKSKKMTKLALLLILHWLIMPFVIIKIIDTFINKSSLLYHSFGFIIAVLWMYIFGRIYTKKITKLKQEIDAEQQK